MSDLYCVILENFFVNDALVDRICSIHTERNYDESYFHQITDDKKTCEEFVEGIQREYPNVKYSIKRIILEDI